MAPADLSTSSLARAARIYVSGGTPPRLTESFSFWTLGHGLLNQPTDDLRQLARPTGRWHHQVKFEDGTLAHARSQVSGKAEDPASWSVRELFDGVLSRTIDETIDEIDKQSSDRFVARLLSVPAFHINALWLVDEQSGEQRIRILTSSPNSRFLRPGPIQDAKHFLEVLRSATAVRGLVKQVVDETAPGRSIEVNLRIRFRRPSSAGGTTE